MKEELLDLLVCLYCQGALELTDAQWSEGEIESGRLSCTGGKHFFPIRRFIPRFVQSDGYTDAFTLEWTEFQTAQLDSQTGLNLSDQTFRNFFNFPPAEMRGKRILNAGCGKGRFAEIALNHGADVMCVDMSFAIDAARKNLGCRRGVHFIQADIFKLPFRRESFDGIYSHGVLHHTPDPPGAFRALTPLIKPGGFISIMVYATYNKAYIKTTTFYRQFTTRLPKRLLLYLCYLAVPLYYVHKIPVFGPFITRILLPVSVNFPTHRWRICNTFDLYSPTYVHFFDHLDIFNWYKNSNLLDIQPVNQGNGISYIGFKAA